MEGTVHYYSGFMIHRSAGECQEGIFRDLLLETPFAFTRFTPSDHSLAIFMDDRETPGTTAHITMLSSGVAQNQRMRGHIMRYH